MTTPEATILSVHDQYAQELSRMYFQADPNPMNTPPRVSDPEVAHDIANGIEQRLGIAEDEYNDTLAEVNASDSPEEVVALKALAHTNRVTRIRSAASIAEFKHQQLVPQDFAEGQNHIGPMRVSPAAKAASRQLALSEAAPTQLEQAGTGVAAQKPLDNIPSKS